MNDLVILHRLLLITMIAGAIGYERERHGRAAGFRTHILVGIGSCLTMLTGLVLAADPAWASRVDPRSDHCGQPLGGGRDRSCDRRGIPARRNPHRAHRHSRPLRLLSA